MAHPLHRPSAATLRHPDAQRARPHTEGARPCAWRGLALASSRRPRAATRSQSTR
jgi:hypothetical protein